MGRLANFGQNNKRRGCNKRRGWHKSPKLINGETGKNKTIRNFIEIKSSNDLGSKCVVVVTQTII